MARRQESPQNSQLQGPSLNVSFSPQAGFSFTLSGDLCNDFTVRGEERWLANLDSDSEAYLVNPGGNGYI